MRSIITDSSSSRRQSGANNVTMSANNNASATVSPAALDETPQAIGNLNWTFAQSIRDAAGAGSIVSWFVSTINGQIFLEKMNRTDINFTVFAVVRDAKPLDALIPLSVVSKMVTPLWYGHFVSKDDGGLHHQGQTLLSSIS
jgi:phosphosulfolactate phosphohydrolase-like enzyme